MALASLRSIPPAELEAMLDALPEQEREVVVAGMEAEEAEESAERWLQTVFPHRYSQPFAAHQRGLLDWAWGIRPGRRSRPHVDVWARGGGKSGIAEGVTVGLGATRRRIYGLYVSGTQENQADPHVSNIGGMLELPQVRRLYPEMAERALTQYGHSKGWKRNRLRTAAGFTLDALGLDTDVRGLRMEDQRPDLIVIDDVDDPLDSPGAVRKKIDMLALSILPLGSDDLTVLVIQNLVHRDGVVAQILDGRAEILADAIVVGPIPAIRGAYSIEATGDEERPWSIVGGEPTWEGQDRDACERQLATFGPTAWESEAQHKPRRLVGGMYEDVLPGVAHCERAAVPDLVRKAIAVDPATTDTDSSDSHGVQCDGIAANDVIYRLRSWESRAAPGEALSVAITWAYEEGVPEVLVEEVGSDLSGRSVEQSWKQVFAGALAAVLDDHPEWRGLTAPRIKRVRATSSTGSKAHRSSQMHADYERPGRIVHVIGDHEVLEAALGRAFVVKPFDLADCCWYSWRDLRRETRGSVGKPTGASVGGGGRSGLEAAAGAPRPRGGALGNPARAGRGPFG